MNRRELATQLHYVLDLHPGPGSRRSPGRLIVNTILDTIATALQRGESVDVHGFGTFHVRDWGGGKHYNHYFYRDKASVRQLVTRKPKKRVWFIPHEYTRRGLIDA